MKMTVLVTAVLASFLGVQSVSAQSAGQKEFMIACAGCHGESGKGDGPIADMLKIATPDLTGLSERNGGKFPFEYTLFMVDRRNVIPMHGNEMPVWGDRYQTPMVRERGETAEMVVRGRILSLVYYIESIQK